MNYKRVNNDINGNPRYVFHFLNFLTDKEMENTKGISTKYEMAVNKSRLIGGKKYRGKDFGGGIVIQSYNIEETINDIKRLQTDEAL